MTPDQLVIAGIGCAVLAVFLIIIRWTTVMVSEANRDAFVRRVLYQAAINECINTMVAPVELPISVAQLVALSDLEWELHTLIYEYRHG